MNAQGMVPPVTGVRDESTNGGGGALSASQGHVGARREQTVARDIAAVHLLWD
jgi:hypothetical protein